MKILETQSIEKDGVAKDGVDIFDIILLSVYFLDGKDTIVEAKKLRF